MPAPGFQVLEPSYLPAGLDVHQTSYYPGRGPFGRDQPIVSSGGVRRAPGSTVSQPVAPPNVDRLLPFAQRGQPALLERYTSDSQPGYVEILERRPGSGGPAPAGERVRVGAVTGILSDEGGRTVITLTERGTELDITTDQGRAEAIKVAESLHS